MRQGPRKIPAAAAWLTLLGSAASPAQPPESAPSVTQPIVSEQAAPLETMAPVAPDGHVGEGYLRRPPGDGPFPALLVIPGGGSPRELLRRHTIGAYPSRFLESGYVVAVITHRSYGPADTPDWSAALADALAAAHYLKALPFIDADSLSVSGCSIGGDVALELAGETSVAAAVAEEPATGLLARMHVLFDLTTPEDMFPVMAEPLRFYTAEARAILAAKVRRIEAPLLIVQGDRPADGDFFLPLQNEILLPALAAAGVEVAEVLRYPDEHCFAMTGVTPAAVEAFGRIEAFVRQHSETEPKRIDESLVEHVPASRNFGRPSVELPLEILNDYAGTYMEVAVPGTPPAPNARVTVTVQEGRLIAEAGDSPPIAISAESETLFFSEIGDLEFFRDSDGNVTHFIMFGVLTYERIDE
jgi:acetyl esterase/lipase